MDDLEEFEEAPNGVYDPIEVVDREVILVDDDTDDEDNNLSDFEMMVVRENEEPNNRRSPEEENYGAPAAVTAFRPVVDARGHVSYEFVFEGSENRPEEPEENNDVQQGQEQVPPENDERNAVLQQPPTVSVHPVRQANLPMAENPPVAQFGIEESEDSDDDDDYPPMPNFPGDARPPNIPPPTLDWSTQFGRAYSSPGEDDMDDSDDEEYRPGADLPDMINFWSRSDWANIPGPSSRLRSPRRNYARNPATVPIPRRKRRRRRQDSAVPKKKVSRARVIERPLKAVKHRENRVVGGNLEDFETAIDLETFCQLDIEYDCVSEDISTRDPKLGEVSVSFQEEISENMLEDRGAKGKCRNITFYVSKIPGRCVLKTVIEKELTTEEATALSLKCIDGRREINNVLVTSYFYHCEMIGISPDCFENTKQKRFNKSFSAVIEQASLLELKVGIYLFKADVLEDHLLQEIPLKKNLTAFSVSNYFLGIPNKQTPITMKSKEDIPWFYGQIRKYHNQENLQSVDETLIQHSYLVPKLRTYQKKAVTWMLSKEGFIDAQYGTKLPTTFREKMYTPVSLENWTGYYNNFIGYFCSSTPNISFLPSGGILADEMGLGKTVEMLALILLNPKPGCEFRTAAVEDGLLSEEVALPKEKRKRLKISSAKKKDKPKPKAKRGRKAGTSKKMQVSSSSDDEEEYEIPQRGRKAGKSKKRQVCSSSDDDEEFENIDAGPSRSQLLVKSLQSDTKTRGRGRAAKNAPKKDEIIIRTNRIQTVATAAIEETVSPSPNPGKKGKGELLKQLQSLYCATLSGFDGTVHAKVKPKFYGKLYETSLDSRAYFECVCGEFREEGDKIVTCIKCSTSQHPKCVGEQYVDRPAKEYVCPHCTVREGLLDASTTLIITPSSISYQWIYEIQRHVQIDNKSLNILFYQGVGKHGYIPPVKLAEYDIVITTYSVLQSEINFTDLPHNNSDEGRKFRNPKRFLSIPSPLPFVNWWRICLDEAQMVEGINTKMAVMAKKLKGIHKWCISGTPLNKGLQDLYGLFSFLEVSPIDEAYWWTNLVHDPFYRKKTEVLYELFGQMIWRTGKSDVLDQLGIPPQTERVHWLNFSAVETHFYRQQLETCSSNLLTKISKLDSAISLNTKLTTLERKTIQTLLQPFLELRQACCHPQMVKGQLISLHKGTLTMEELLEQLTKKTSVMCAEDHRLMVAAWNGMAGLSIIQKNMVQASEWYRKVLQSAEKYKANFPTDTLQLLHTMENLSDLIDGNYQGVPYTLRDEKLRTEAEDLKRKYLQNYENGVRNAILTLAPLTDAVQDLNGNFHCKSESWWWLALSRAASTSKADDLITRIKTDLFDKMDKKRKNIKSMANKFEDVLSLQHVLVENLSGLDDCRQSVLKSIEEMKGVEPVSLVDGAVVCHLRNQSQMYYNDTTSATCTLCQYHAKMIEYESLLFWEDQNANVTRTGRKWQQKKLMGNLAEDLSKEEQEIALMREQEELFESTEHVQLFGKAVEKSWQDSETEKTIKILSNFARINGSSVRVIEDGANHIKLYQAMKKEYKFIRILFRQIFDQVAAVDELNQATTRLRLRYDGEQVTSQPLPSSKKALSSGISKKIERLLNVHVVEKTDVPFKMEQMNVDALTGEQSLALHFGQLQYLNSLKSTGYGKKGTFNQDECPICQSPLGTEWSVLSCGHCYCKECIKKICPSTSVNFLCPLCRVSLKTAEISFVDTNEEEDQEPAAGPSKVSEVPERKREIVGSHSTKVQAVVEQLFKLQETHPREKVIVFSTWSDVLDILCRAFDQNEIQYCILSQSGFQKDLHQFKTREDIQVLLMPLSFGAKGLNLIEATHVFLVEPILSKASELQAIGRVHRIGQTKPTFVHRFFVKNTIEEKLYEILKLHDVTSDEEGSLTIQDLKNIVTM